MAYYKIVLKFNQQNLGQAVNVYHFRNASGGPTDSELLGTAAAYLDDIYGPLRPSMDSGCSLLECRLLEVNLMDETIRVVGTMGPGVSGTAAGDQLALVSAASMFARTDAPKVRGSKRLPGISEGRHADGLFDNTLLSALAQSAIKYISNRGSILTWIFEPGVISTVDNTWHRFVGTAVVTNVPGTQVTRKPLRGA